jgi:cytochrome oxidase Cu insertion factor (SCO1/SenC/PrrC family)
MRFSADYPNNPPALWKDLFKIDLMKTMKKKFGMRQAFAEFPNTLPIGSPAPDFTLLTAAGETVSLSSLRGKVIVLEFGAIT